MGAGALAAYCARSLSGACRSGVRRLRAGSLMAAKTNRRAVSAPAKRVPAKQDWGQMSPELRALPNDQWRAFCHALVTGPGGHGKYAAAYRAAGLGKESDNTTLAK